MMNENDEDNDGIDWVVVGCFLIIAIPLMFVIVVSVIMKQ